MSDSESPVNCETHGAGSATFLCQHLVQGEKRGFNAGYDPEDPCALFPDAWCDECEAVLDRDGEWNDVSESLAGVTMVCSGCYQEIRARNWIQDDEAWDDLIAESFAWLQEKQQPFLDEFRITEHDRWDWDQDSGLLVFSNAGTPRVEAEISFSGTLSTARNTWMWAWANDSLTEKIKSDSLAMRELGDDENYLKLASALWPANEADGWAMTAVMAMALDAIGAYRTPDEAGFAYMIVKSARWLTG